VIGERADLVESLQRHRGFLIFTTRGLTDEQAAQRTAVSELCIVGLIKHVAVVTEWDFAGSLTPRLELGFALGQWMLRPPANRTTVTAFRDGYVHTAGQWPQLDLSSFAVAVTG
jgi:hypothetical protein